jgi:hypothetical protein
MVFIIVGWEFGGDVPLMVLSGLEEISLFADRIENNRQSIGVAVQILNLLCQH